MTYRLGAKWRAFFEELGREVRVSEPSDRGVFERGQALSVDECCLASKLFLGHVDALAGEVDAVFVPSLSSSDALHTYCTKFQALPDLVRSAFALAGREVRVLDALLAEGAAEKDERASYVELAARPDRHSRKRVAFMHYGYYDVAFQYFTEHVLDADYVRMSASTRRTLEIGSEHSNDYVCAPFKHILGDYVEALEAGANVLVLLRMVEHLDAYNDYYLANAGFEVEPRSFERAREAFFEDMRCCSTMADVDQAFRRGMDALRALPTSKPERPCAWASWASSSPPPTPPATSR